MNTKNMDVVYFVKEGAYNPELIYSVRSVCKNLKFRRLWFIGGCPKGILPDVSHPFRRISNVKTKNTAAMFRLVCQIDEISDDFLFFNDDFFVMKPTDEIKPRFFGTLEEKSAQIRQQYGSSTRWSTLLKIAADELIARRCNTYNFELHCPMVINKKKMAKIIELFPGVGCKRSLYGNYYNLFEEGEAKPDGKVHSLDIVPHGLDMLSTDDISFAQGAVGKEIRGKFPKPSKYEID